MIANKTIGDNTVKTIADIAHGQECRVLGLGKGRCFRNKMFGIGIRPGIKIQVIQGQGNGPKVVRIGRQKVMIGREMLSNIFVRQEDEE